MIRKSVISSFILLLAMLIVSIGSFADSNLSSNVLVSNDPIHPYIHELMDSSESNIKIVDDNQFDITEEIKSNISIDYYSGNFDKVFEYLNNQKFIFIHDDKAVKTYTSSSIGSVPFSFTDKYISSMYNLEMIFTVTNQIFISNDKFSGYTDPVWTLNYQSPAPITLVLLNLNPSIVNSGYSYRLGISFVVSLYQYVYPQYNNVVYYHYI
jgi:hypothetical protein